MVIQIEIKLILSADVSAVRQPDVHLVLITIALQNWSSLLEYDCSRLDDEEIIFYCETVSIVQSAGEKMLVSTTSL